MRRISFFVYGLAMVLMAANAQALGDSRLRKKIDQKKLAQADRCAIVAFSGNSVVTGNMGLGSLVTGALAKKKEGEHKLALDETYFSEVYDAFVNTLAQEGYHFVPAEEVVKSRAYQEATTLEMPTMKNAKGLKNVNTSKAESIKKIAEELKADLLFHVTSGHSLGMRSNIGTVVGKQLGIATAMIVVYDANGKKLGYIDASEVSNQRAGAVAGGFSDPNKVMPLLKEADQNLIAKVAAGISKK